MTRIVFSDVPVWMDCRTSGILPQLGSSLDRGRGEVLDGTLPQLGVSRDESSKSLLTCFRLARVDFRHPVAPDLQPGRRKETQIQAIGNPRGALMRRLRRRLMVDIRSDRSGCLVSAMTSPALFCGAVFFDGGPKALALARRTH